MLTREGFLSTGLIAVDNASLSKDDDCAICLGCITDPVRLPCNHIFDRDCITSWLSQRCRNTCPLDKTKFFTLPPNEDPRPDPGRQQRAAIALRLSGLTGSRIETFDASPYTDSDLRRATAQAVHIFGTNEPSLNVSGPVLISTRQLAGKFIAIGNLLPAWSAADGQPYRYHHTMEWKLVMSHLWSLLKAKEGEKYDALLLPAKLRIDVYASLKDAHTNIDNMAIFASDTSPDSAYQLSDDFDVLLRYLTQHFWTVQRVAEASEAAGRTEKKPRKESGCSIM